MEYIHDKITFVVAKIITLVATIVSKEIIATLYSVEMVLNFKVGQSCKSWGGQDLGLH
jgi:hypothetical protein